MNRAWAATVIVLGAWETLAVLGRMPTITSTISRCHVRRRRTTRAVVGVFLIGLGHHLLADAT